MKKDYKAMEIRLQRDAKDNKEVRNGRGEMQKLAQTRIDYTSEATALRNRPQNSPANMKLMRLFARSVTRRENGRAN